jgi:hypothetical protein
MVAVQDAHFGYGLRKKTSNEREVHSDLVTLTIRLRSLTQATDTSNIRLVFAAVKDTILHRALADSGIL